MHAALGEEMKAHFYVKLFAARLVKMTAYVHENDKVLQQLSVSLIVFFFLAVKREKLSSHRYVVENGRAVRTASSAAVNKIMSKGRSVNPSFKP